MYRYTLQHPRFKVGQRVTDGSRVGLVIGKTFNAYLKRESTDTWNVKWVRTTKGQFVSPTVQKCDGKGIEPYNK